MIYFTILSSAAIMIAYLIGLFEDYKLSKSMNFLVAFIIVVTALTGLLQISIPLTVLAACLGFFSDTIPE